MNTTTDALRDHYPLRMSHSYATVIHDLCDEVDRLRAALATCADMPSPCERQSGPAVSMPQGSTSATIRCWRCKRDVPEETTMCMTGVGTQCKDSASCSARRLGASDAPAERFEPLEALRRIAAWCAQRGTSHESCDEALDSIYAIACTSRSIADRSTDYRPPHEQAIPEKRGGQ